jgi:hypothetical protein
MKGVEGKVPERSKIGVVEAESGRRAKRIRQAID